MARAVFSMSVSGRRLARTIATPTMARATTMIALTSRSSRASQARVWLTAPRFSPTTTITLSGLPTGPNGLYTCAEVCVTMTSQLSPLCRPGTVVS
jgi:hypothetical protein